jgi:hypothetical protein
MARTAFAVDFFYHMLPFNASVLSAGRRSPRPGVLIKGGT